MEQCRFGIIGPGGIAEKFAGTFQMGLVKNAKLTAVASRSPAKAEAFAEKYHIPRVCAGYDALLAAPQVDAVYIAVTNQAHYDCCMRSIAAGKHVLCEKPLAMTAREAKELARAAREKGVFLMEAMWSRFLPATNAALGWVRQGRIGSLRAVSASLCACRPQEGYPRLYDPALGGGALYDLGVYGIEFVQLFAKNRELSGIRTTLVPSGTGVDGAAFLHLSYADGLVGEVKCAVTFHARNEAYLCGDKGYIRIAPWFHYAQKAELFTEPMAPSSAYELQEPADVFLSPTPSGFEFQIEHAAQCIRAGKMESEIMPLADTVEAAGIFDRALAALQKETTLL
ncbi:Gfo/Idh/MocA family protein [Anaerotruncus rubiinfantis]|uniref:Gfo/Idh/MocA family protein n=2 Tax=Anaerotruncus rubiinfantis TaxID=1720200 RepID=UPI00189A5BEE|nr:Gfo/Idh/MocA family oxidoreductase [Anaerotruncus rubiinfantis]